MSALDTLKDADVEAMKSRIERLVKQRDEANSRVIYLERSNGRLAKLNEELRKEITFLNDKIEWQEASDLHFCRTCRRGREQ